MEHVKIMYQTKINQKKFATWYKFMFLKKYCDVNWNLILESKFKS